MNRFTRALLYVLLYMFFFAVLVLRHLPYFKFRQERSSRPSEPTHRPSSRVDSSHGSTAPRDEAQEVRKMNRAVGYCQYDQCEDFAKGVFLINYGDTFHCGRCKQRGRAQAEQGFYTGNSDVFKEVRVEFNYDPLRTAFREIAIVRDESLWGRCNVYTLQSPLIKTEKRALKVAEAILSNLNRYRGTLRQDEIPRTHEVLLSFDDNREEFSRKLSLLAKDWEESTLVERNQQKKYRAEAAA